MSNNAYGWDVDFSGDGNAKLESNNIVRLRGRTRKDYHQSQRKCPTALR